MKQTKNYLLNLMEVVDVLSAKPLNENAEKIEEALLAQQNAIAGKLMMATGSYTGNGKRSVTIQTPGFQAKALLLRERYSGWPQSTNISLWLGQNIDTGYLIAAASNNPPYQYEPGEQFEIRITATIKFEAKTGELKWSIPGIPDKYYDVTTDGGPSAMNNENGTTYEWIAFGTAEE